MQDSIEPTPQAPTASPAPADVPDPAGAVAPVPVAPAGGSPSATPTAGATVARPAPASLVGRLLAVLKREPVLFISLSYILVSFFGIWSTYWFYRTLGLPILDYLQGSDLFIAGLRRPEYVLLLAAALLLLWVSALPWRWAEDHPERTEDLRRNRWWGSILFPDQNGWTGLWGTRSDTLLAVTFLFLSLYNLHAWNVGQAQRLLDGKPHGQQVRLTLSGDDAPLPGQASLLGTTSAFVLVWWPEAARAEVLPTANIARIETILTPPRPVARPAGEPAGEPPGASAAEAEPQVPAAAPPAAQDGPG